MAPKGQPNGIQNSSLACKINRKAEYSRKGHDLPGKSEPEIMNNPTKNECDFGYQNRYKNMFNLYPNIAETESKRSNNLTNISYLHRKENTSNNASIEKQNHAKTP